MGDILRFDTNGSLTFARADTIPTAEALGMVEVASGSTLTLVTKGFISGLTGTRINALKPLVTGNAYYLSQSVGGGMIANPDSGAYEITAGQVRKAMFIASGIDKGYVVNYTGVVVGSDPTDLIYLSRVAPVGSVHPFAGLTSAIPDGWLLCNGAAIPQNTEVDLFAAIENIYHADATVYDSSTITIVGDTRGLATNDAVRVVWSTGSANLIVSSVNTTTRRVVFADTPFTDLLTNTDVKVYGRTVASTVGRSVFFVPDLRRRTVFGTSFGSGLAGSGNLTPSLALGSVGGEHEVTLSSTNIPPHTHTLNTTVKSDTSGIYGSSSTQTGDLVGLGEDPTAFSILPPHVAMHYIIRAKKGVSATILTGHNHDNQYIRYDIAHTTGAGAARTLTDSDRTQFRANAKVLRNDGDDVMHGTLQVTGDLMVKEDLSVTGSVSVGEDLSVVDALTVGGVSRFDSAMKVTGGSVTIVNANGAKEWANYTPVNGGSSQWNDAGLKIVGGSQSKTTINLFNNNSIPAGESTDGYKDQGRINFYGVSLTGENQPPQYTASLGYALYGPNMVASDENTLQSGQYEYRVGFNLAGKNGSSYVDETALLISRKSNAGIGDGSIKYRLPKLLETYNSNVVNNSVLINPNGELRLGPPSTVGTVAIQVWNGTFDGSPEDRGTVVMPANTANSNGIFAIVSNKKIAVKGAGTWNGYISVRNTPDGDTYTTFTPFENKTTNEEIQIVVGSFTSCSVLVHAYRID
jgi:microcystin-dependent protein